MNNEILLQLPDEIWKSLVSEAEARGEPVSVHVENILAERYGAYGSAGNEADREAARARFKAHFGSVRIGKGLDNEQIDAELARVYANEEKD